MKASRSLIPGGWFYFGDQPPPSRGEHWLLLAAAMLLLAGRPVAGADPALPAWLEDDDGAPAEEFSGDTPVFHTKEAPSDAQVRQRIRNSAGLRGMFSITRNPEPGSAASATALGVVLTSGPHQFLPQLPPEQHGLAVFTAGVIVRHFEKLSTWSGQSGAGVLYPINARVGLFVDARTVMPNGSRYYGIARAGLRILF